MSCSAQTAPHYCISPAFPIPHLLLLSEMGNSFELHSVNGNSNAIDAMEKSSHHTETEMISQDQRDAQALARLGKKPVLKVY